MKVAVVKYNAGNIRSVDYALKRLGVEAVITADEAVLRAADKVIFPGVGKAYTFSVNNVNSGNQFYHFIYNLTIYSSRKFRKIRSPTLPLFSGWNCVA